MTPHGQTTPDLNVSVAGIPFKNPVIAASCAVVLFNICCSRVTSNTLAGPTMIEFDFAPLSVALAAPIGWYSSK